MTGVSWGDAAFGMGGVYGAPPGVARALRGRGPWYKVLSRSVIQLIYQGGVNMKVPCVLIAVGAVAAVAGAKEYLRMEADPAYLKEGGSRTFTVTYKGVVKDVPADAKKLRVWIP